MGAELGTPEAVESLLEQEGSNRTVTLNGPLTKGQIFSYTECGAENGQPLFYFTGIGGSRYLGHSIAKKACQHGYRVYCFDYPGSGNSSPQPGRSLTDWCDSFSEIIDTLVGSETKIVLIGHSAGTINSVSSFVPD